jgi:hypothetical protein
VLNKKITSQIDSGAVLPANIKLLLKARVSLNALKALGSRSRPTTVNLHLSGYQGELFRSEENQFNEQFTFFFSSAPRAYAVKYNQSKRKPNNQREVNLANMKFMSFLNGT